MCGIAGYFLREGLEPGVLESMVAALRHRGPDAEGFYRSAEFAGGMRRLSINDLVTGDQPLFNETRDIVLLYNGEIYNSPSLRAGLVARGHTFRTHSDGEVICHLYEEQGEALFEALDGMFAVALWIESAGRLVLARDIPGEKPLYYSSLSDTEVVFASEIRSLLQCPLVDRTLNGQALWDFPTFLWVPEPETVYWSVKAVPPSHLLVVGKDGTRLQPYRNRFGPPTLGETDEAVVDTVRTTVTEAVRSRLLSDVPVGSFLSGGLDSSIVATVAARNLPELTTFTIGFEDAHDPYHGRANEAHHAEAYARRLGTRHHTIPVTAEDFRRNLETFCVHGDQPFAVSSGLGILSIAEAAHAQGIKVLLSGDGADECFGGYSWYFHLRGGPRVPGQRPPGGSVVSFQNFGMDLSQRLAILQALSPQERAWAWHYYASESEKALLFSPERFEGVSSSLRFFEAFDPSGDWSPEQFIAQDRQFYLPFEMLRKVDRMTMAHSVEGRVPFVAPGILSLAAQLEYRHMVRGDSLKWALREAFRDFLPRDIAIRPKHGFNVPIDLWLKGDWADLMEDTFAADSALAREGLIGPGSREHALAMLDDPQRLNGHTVFCFVMLNMWLEQVHGNHR